MARTEVNRFGLGEMFAALVTHHEARVQLGDELPLDVRDWASVASYMLEHSEVIVPGTVFTLEVCRAFRDLQVAQGVLEPPVHSWADVFKHEVGESDYGVYTTAIKHQADGCVALGWFLDSFDIDSTKKHLEAVSMMPVLVTVGDYLYSFGDRRRPTWGRIPALMGRMTTGNFVSFQESKMQREIMDWAKAASQTELFANVVGSYLVKNGLVER